MKVTSTLNAWKEAQKHITNYEKDHEASKNAGYNIYKGENGYICDLETRLEINLDNGESFNIWIEEESQKPKTTKTEKYINVDISTEETTNGKTTTTKEQTYIFLSATTTLSDLGEFVATVERYIKQAKKATKKGNSATINIFVDNGKISCWTARPEDISDDGVYFSPSINNEHPECDFFITGKNLLKELQI
jgi:hypothetical protein